MYLQVLVKSHKSDLLDPAITSVLQGPASSWHLLGFTKYTFKYGFLGIMGWIFFRLHKK